MNAKAEFVLKRSISHDLFNHIMGCKSTGEIWDTLDGLFNKRKVTRLQLLENELANSTQGDLSISSFFLKIKNLCSEISTLDLEEPILEARMKRHHSRVEGVYSFYNFYSRMDKSTIFGRVGESFCFARIFGTTNDGFSF